MPNTGTPRSNTAGSSCGAPSSYTLDGPPDSTMACGSLALISSMAAVCGMTSEYTRASRTRRAISCAYCAPKSTTSTGRGDAGCTGSVYGRGPSPPSEQVRDRLQPRLVQHAGEHAPVDLDGGAVDEVGRAAAEEHAGPADLDGFTRAAQRNVAKVVLASRVLLGQHKRPEVVGHRRTERKRVDPGMR